MRQRTADSGKSVSPEVAGLAHDLSAGLPGDVRQLEFRSGRAAPGDIDEAALRAALPAVAGDHGRRSCAPSTVWPSPRRRLLEMVAREPVENWGAKAVQRELDLTRNAARAAGRALEEQGLVGREGRRWVLSAGRCRSG